MAVALAKEDTHVDEVWSLDLVNQGDSAILNAEHLGPACKLKYDVQSAPTAHSYYLDF